MGTVSASAQGTTVQAEDAGHHHADPALKKVEPTLHLGLAATFTAEPLIPLLRTHLIEAGIPSDIKLGPFNQLLQVCLDHRSHFGEDRDVIILLWRMEDLLLDEITVFLQGDSQAWDRALDKVGLITQALSNLRNSFAGSIIINVPPFPSALPAHLRDLANPTGLGALHRAVASAFVEKNLALKGVRLFDLDALQRHFGLAASFDSRLWYLYRQPFSQPFLLEMGNLLGRIVASLRRPAKKCIVLDCDNTLWGGIVGEDGVTGIQVGDEFPGSAYRDFQRMLIHWRQQGFLLAIISKNNEADVWEVFEKHSGMVLKREDISAWRINWNPKAENIVQIAEDLNIGTDSLVFVDDSAMEIGYMRAGRPEVESILFPEEPADIVNTFRGLSFFDRLEITREDRQRADMMRAEKERAALSMETSLSKEQFQSALGLRLDLFLATAEDLDRIAQLINKTNQFNLTTIRRSSDEVRQLAASSVHRLFGLRVADKFGEYGLTGVVIVEISPDRSRWTLDTLLLSCRVLGRGVETALLAALAEEARTAGAVEMTASFIPTAKNAPAASFLPDHGFDAGENPTWHIKVAAIPPVSASITLNSPSTKSAVALAKN